MKNKIYSLLEKIKYAYWNIVPYEYRPLNLLESFKYKFITRPNWVKSRYLCSWPRDYSDLLPYTMMEILCRFYEEEFPGIVNWSALKIKLPNSEIKFVDQEIIDIYNWWTKWYNGERLSLREEIHNRIEKYQCTLIYTKTNDLSDLDIRPYTIHYEFKNKEEEKLYNEAIEDNLKLENKTQQELNDHLIRLVNIKDYLWT